MSQATGAKITPKMDSSLPETTASVRGQQVMNTAKNAIDQCDQREERNQHGGDIQREVKAVRGSLGRSIEHVAVLLLELRRVDAWCAGGEWLFGFRHQHLGDEDRSRRSHDDRRQQVPRFDAKAMYAPIIAPETCAMPRS